VILPSPVEHDMKIECAECGCLVDRGVVVRRCDRPDCCCADLPDGSGGATPEAT
jgi:hypothetical protein